MGTATQQRYKTEWAENTWNESLAYIKKIVDTAYHPFLILDEHLHVLVANKFVYKLFHIDEKDTEPKYVNELGSGVWNTHALGALLTGILPKHIFFNGIEVSSEFPSIGKKIMLLNGRRMYSNDSAAAIFSPIILLTMEDSTQMTVVTAELADYAARIKSKMSDRTKKLEAEVGQLKKEVSDLNKNAQGRSSQ